MSIDITQYCVAKVESRRTHKDGIDIQVGDVRSFLSDTVAQELIGKMFKALATPFVEKVEEAPSGHDES